MNHNEAGAPLHRETHEPSPLAGLLSYLVPGLGQIMQGRIGKGLLFFVCLYALFFYGLYLGNWQNVYVRSGAEPAGGRGAFGVFSLISHRVGFIGQVWIGVAAWPAIWQYASYNPNEDGHPVLGRFQRMPTEFEMNETLRNSDKTPDIGWMYTVIAGVLNILVIYDAYAGPAMGLPRRPRREDEPAEEDKP
jgi:hypothetical protein